MFGCTASMLLVTEATMSSSAPRPARFPAGGRDGSLTCDRCGEPATHGYEGSGGEGLDLCNPCWIALGKWLNGGVSEQ